MLLMGIVVAVVLLDLRASVAAVGLLRTSVVAVGLLSFGASVAAVEL